MKNTRMVSTATFALATALLLSGLLVPTEATCQENDCEVDRVYILENELGTFICFENPDCGEDGPSYDGTVCIQFS